MAKYSILYTCHEIQIDNNDNFIKEYKTNLPHGKQIADTFCNQWNKDAKDFMLDLINKDCFDRFESCKMKALKNKTDTTLAIECIAKPGKQITQKVKDALNDFMSAQFSDGWGEGMFGLINVMTAPDGTRFYVD